MKTSERGLRADIYVWIVAAEAWEPATVFDEPVARRVLFPAIDRSLTREEAAAFVTGFNEQMLAHGGRRWAIARRCAWHWSETERVALRECGWVDGGSEVDGSLARAVPVGDDLRR
jgi:hypothetical protein